MSNVSYRGFVHLLEFLYTDTIFHFSRQYLEKYRTENNNASATDDQNNNNNNNNNSSDKTQAITFTRAPIISKHHIPSLQTLAADVVWKNIDQYDFESFLATKQDVVLPNQANNDQYSRPERWMQWL